METIRTLTDRARRAWTRPRCVAAFLAVIAALLTVVVGETVFPYFSSNHDEAVYLQQAALLLDGQLALQPPVAESFRPWFFLAEDGRLYPKYMPVTAALFAVGGLVGSVRLALAVIAAVTVGLTYAVVTELFDAETGVVAAALLVASPLFLVNASVFLPYVPALCLNLLFAWAYLRADRTDDTRFAGLAGGAIGVSFFARPYTAVLFAAPFIAHALWQMRGLDRGVLRRQSATALLGLCGVASALAYNAVVTGDPLLFPYEAFAPEDGLGFGHRQLLDYERTYTLSLALEANARNLLTYATRWTPAGPLGSLLAVTGLGAVVSRADFRPDPRVLSVAGLFVTIPLGNVYFWGTLNVLGDLSDPTDGLISFLGPYYHAGLLLPTVAFGAVGVRYVVGVVRARRAEIDSARLRHATTVVALAVALVVTAVTAGVLMAPLADNHEVTEQYDHAYEPFEDREFENAVVFLPTPYGDWLNHPFQHLRNDPGYDGDAVYALQHRELAVAGAFPDRTLYRYTYRGEWIPYAGDPVEPRLRRIQQVRGERIHSSLSLGVPPPAGAMDVRASIGEAGNSTTVNLTRDRVDATVTVADGTASVSSPQFAENLTVPVSNGSLRIVAFVDYGSLGGFEYVVRYPLAADGGTYRALSPYLEVCRVPSRCGDGAAYVPGSHREGVWLNATLDARGDGP